MKKLLFLLFTLHCSLFTCVAQTYKDVNAPIEQRIEDALSRMTLQEKVNLCHATSKFYSPGVPRLGIPGLWSSDGPHGVRMEMAATTWDYAHWNQDSCTAFPSLTCLAATWNPEMSLKYGKAIGEEARFRNKNVLLGPGVNIARTPLNGRNFEYMGEDPYLSSQMCVPYIRGVQQNGVAACVKHYALNNQEWQRWTISSECSERALREIYLPAFKAAVQQGGAWSLMGAYNKIRGTHACHNDYTLNKILKGEWGFDGAVMSDWDGTHNTMEAALGGLDIEMGTSSRRDKGINDRRFTYDECYLGNDFRDLIQAGKIPESAAIEKARRVLRLIFRTSMNGSQQYGNQDYAAHSAVCREIGSEGIVLLRNEQLKSTKKALLPIEADRYNKILVVGDNATRKLTVLGGSSELKAQHETSPLAALRRLYGDKIVYAHGYEAGRTFYDHEEEIPAAITDSLRREAVEMAKGADLIIFVGGINKSKHQDCEDADRRNYDLPYGQNELLRELIAVNTNLVAVFMGGTPVRIPGFDKADGFKQPVPAILWAWYLGSDGGDALCDVLTGAVNPSGKLPVTFPARLEDTPAAHFGDIAYPGKDGKVEYKEDILVGYRWYDTKHIAPLFPFGHGMSYTTFAYSNLRLSSGTLTDSITVSVDVKNTGKRDGKEIVQLYITDDKCTELRPAKELKHFDKKMIAAGKTETYNFTITKSDLQFYSEAQQAWMIEPGTFTLHIGSSSADIRLKGKIKY